MARKGKGGREKERREGLGEVQKERGRKGIGNAIGKSKKHGTYSVNACTSQI